MRLKVLGVIVTAIDDEGPAAEADFEVGDLLLTFDGKSIENVRGLTRIVAETEIGKAVKVDLIRDRKRRTVSFEVGELASNNESETRKPLPENALAQNPLGAELKSIDDDARRRYGIARSVDGVLVRLLGELVARGDVEPHANLRRDEQPSGAVDRQTHRRVME